MLMPVRDGAKGILLLVCLSVSECMLGQRHAPTGLPLISVSF